MINKRLIAIMGNSIKYVIFTVVLSVLSLLCNIIFVYSISSIFEILFTQGILLTGRVKVYLILILASIVVRYICAILTTKFSFKASIDVKKKLRFKMMEKLLSIGSEYKNSILSSEVTQVSVDGIEQLEMYFSQFLPQFFYSMIAPIILFVFLSFFSFKSALVMLICVPLIPISIVLVMKYAKKLLANYWNTYSDLGGSFVDNIQGLTTLKIYQQDQDYSKKMDDESERFRKITMKVLSMQLNSLTLMDVIAFGGAALADIIVLSQYSQGLVNLKAVILVVLLSAEFFIPLRTLGSFFHVSMNGIAASEKIFRILDIDKDSIGNEEFPDDFDGITLQNVDFSYSKDREVLHDLNFKIKKNSIVSIVGESGSGKSTIGKLLSTINKGYDGSIKIGDRELKDIREEALLSNLTLVSSSNHIFKGSVRDNLDMANQSLTDDELEKALEKVNLLEFFSKQEGLNTFIKEDGSNLSGGQKQRLAIARSLLNDSKVYIFDESTSNIDIESEEIIMNLIYALAENKTVIIISHRLLNVVNSDEIFVLKDGSLVETGNHESLLKDNGYYCEMFNKQMDLEKIRKESTNEKIWI